MIKNNFFIMVICILVVIFDFFLFWGIIPKQIGHHESRDKTILNKDKYIKALKKAVIIQSIIYGVLIILIVGVLKNLKMHEIMFIMTGYIAIRYGINYRIEKKYVIKNSSTK